MIPALMDGSIILLPKPIPFIGLIIVLISAIGEMRRGYMGRIGIATNAFLLWQIFFNYWNSLPELYQWYLNFGTVAAVIAIFTYLTKISLPTEFYELSLIFYGSLSVLLTIIMSY